MSDRRLNVLVYPMWSVDNVNADSNYIIIKQICNVLIPQNTFNFYLIMDSNRKYVRDDLHPFVKLISIPFPRSKKLQVSHWNTNAIRKILNTYPIDIVWNNVVEKGHHFKWFADTLDIRGRAVVFNYHHYVIHRSLDKTSMYNVCQHILADQISGSLQADCNYFHTEYCKNMMMEEAKDYLHPDRIKVLESKSITKLGGYCEEQPKQKKYDEYTFLYNHRLAGYKNWKTTWALFDELYEEGYKFQVIITGGDKDGLKKAERPYTKVKSFKTHQDYLKEVQKCHANVINSKHETYCIAIAESILANHVVVAPNKVTFPELLGNKYPYLFNSLAEQKQMLQNILDEQIKYIEHDKPRLLIQQHAEFIGKTWCQLYDQIKGKANILQGMKDPTKMEIYSKYLEKNPTLKFETFVKLVRKTGLMDQAMPIARIKMLLDQQGYKYNIVTDLFER